MTSSSSSPEIKLVSSDGETFIINRDAITQSVTIDQVIEDIGGDSDAPIHLDIVASTLTSVVEYCIYHHRANQDAKDANAKDAHEAKESKDDKEAALAAAKAVVDEWDQNFIKGLSAQAKFHVGIMHVLKAADHLRIVSLLKLTSDALYHLMSGKTPEEIRETFNIVNDFTPEEEAEVVAEGMWVLAC